MYECGCIARNVSQAEAQLVGGRHKMTDTGGRNQAEQNALSLEQCVSDPHVDAPAWAYVECWKT